MGVRLLEALTGKSGQADCIPAIGVTFVSQHNYFENHHIFSNYF